MLSIDRHAIVETSSVGCSDRSILAEGLLSGGGCGVVQFGARIIGSIPVQVTRFYGCY